MNVAEPRAILGVCSKDHGVERRSLDLLQDNPRNARKHSKSQIAKVAKSIAEFGFINPIVVDAKIKSSRAMRGSLPPSSLDCQLFL